MVAAAHARYVALYHHLKMAIESADYAALEAMSAQLRALPNGQDRRVACLALHDVAAGLPLRGGEHFERLLHEVCGEGEEYFLRALEAMRNPRA